MKKRSKIIVNPKVQFRLIGLMVCVSVLPMAGLFTFFLLYIRQLLAEIPSEETALLALVESVKVLNYMTFGGFIGVVFFLVLVVLHFLHKIIGPLYRIEKDLEAIIETNDFSRELKVRKNDYFHSYVELINQLLKKIPKNSER